MDIGPILTQDDLILIPLITSAKTLFAIKVTFTGTRSEDMDVSFGDTFNLLPPVVTKKVHRRLGEEERV